MTGLLLRQITQGRQKLFSTEYNKYIGHKRSSILNSVIPNLHQNLYDSTKAFIEAVVALDSEFIQSTATVALQQVLIPEIESLKAARTSIRLVPWKKDQQQNPENSTFINPGDQKEAIFIVAPYVIFGQTMEERLKLQRPWQYTRPLFATNRFLAINPIEGFSLSKLMNNQIFGFNCYMILLKSFEITENNKTSIHPPKEFLVSFETNSENHQFFVSDCNNLVRNIS